MARVADRSAFEGARQGRVAWVGPACATVVILAFIPTLVLFGADLWSRPHYRFVPLVIPGAAALLWRHCRQLGELEASRRERSAATYLAIASWVLLAAGVGFLTFWFAAVGALVAILAALLALGGKPLVLSALPAWAFLWLAIPPPRKYDFLLVAKLQGVVSRLADTLLDTLGVVHVMAGNIVEVAGRELLVDEACSGIYSLFTLLVGTLLYAFWVRVSVARGVFLLVATGFWVIVGNTLRVVIVVLATRYGVDLSTGWRHEALGLAMFSLMLGMVVSTDQLMSAVASTWRSLTRKPKRKGTKSRSLGLSGKARRETVGRPSEVRNATGTPDPLWEPAGAEPTRLVGLSRTWVGKKTAAVAFGLLLAPQAFIPGVRWKNVLLASEALPRSFEGLNASSMPAYPGTLRRVGFTEQKRDWDNSWGEYSRTWNYSAPGRSVSVSVDYQFVEWHELTLCYRSRGWTMLSRKTMPASAVGGGSGSVVTAEFGNLEGQYASLLFGLYDRKGRPLDPPDTVSTLTLLGERLRSWVRTGEAGGRDGELLSYQIQCFQISEHRPSEQEFSALCGLFDETRRRVDRVVMKGAGQ